MKKLVTGYWLLVSGFLLLVTGFWPNNENQYGRRKYHQDLILIKGLIVNEK